MEAFIYVDKEFLSPFTGDIELRDRDLDLGAALNAEREAFSEEVPRVFHMILSRPTLWDPRCQEAAPGSCPGLLFDCRIALAGGSRYACGSARHPGGFFPHERSTPRCY